ncbi:hypothetical protein F4779DRAFT_637931 [Xylariaceae sp. FL0662B]|nr:hypothetical protein F4779DRAFT_637931 [Xylariaceae sp. FL0662B]
MDNRRGFEPSRQLRDASTGNQGQASGYRGDRNVPSNRSENVPSERNTNLWLTGLPEDTTVTDLLGSIRGVGRVRATVIHPAESGHAQAAASISFFEREDAEKFYHLCKQKIIKVRGDAVNVDWNRNRIDQVENNRASRVLLIAGDEDFVNKESLDNFFKERFVYDIDKVVDHGVVTPPDGGRIGRLEYRFGSWRSQAQSAEMALTFEQVGKVLVEFGEDPCN